MVGKYPWRKSSLAKWPLAKCPVTKDLTRLVTLYALVFNVQLEIVSSKHLAMQHYYLTTWLNLVLNASQATPFDPQHCLSIKSVNFVILCCLRPGVAFSECHTVFCFWENQHIRLSPLLVAQTNQICSSYQDIFPSCTYMLYVKKIYALQKMSHNYSQNLMTRQDITVQAKPSWIEQVRPASREWTLTRHTLRKEPTTVTLQVVEWNPQGKRKTERPKRSRRRSTKETWNYKGKNWANQLAEFTGGAAFRPCT